MPNKANALLAFYGNAQSPNNLPTVSIPTFKTGSVNMGSLFIKFSGSAFASAGSGTLTLNLHWSPNPFNTTTNLPNAGNKLLTIQTYANNPQQHLALVEGSTKITNYGLATTYYLKITQGKIPTDPNDLTTTDWNDYCGVTVIEFAP